MWVDNKASWLRTVMFGGRALPRIWRRAFTVAAMSVVVSVGYELVPRLHHSITPTPFVLIGLPLGIFLGFRNTAAYDRFWEGRKLWGQLVNTSRSFTRQVLTLVGPAEGDDPAEVRLTEVELVHLLIAYVHALRLHLRDENPASALPALDATNEPNVPVAILHRMGDHVIEAAKKGRIHPFHVPVLEQSLTILTDVQGACERIKSTPLPYSYSVLMHRIVAGYCVLLPFGLAETAGLATPFVVLAISYALFGLDAVGDELEQPFGMDINDLPLTSISTAIEANARARIGEPQPAKIEPVDRVLS